MALKFQIQKEKRVWFQLNYENQKLDLTQFTQFVSENLPKYAIPIFIRVKEGLEFTGTHKLRKVNLKKQGYNINIINDRIYFWNSDSIRYEVFDDEIYTNLLDNTLKI